jgi:hypothetical protein
MATPHVAGAAALVLAANPSATPAQVRDALVNAATTGAVGSPGSGSPNRLLYVGEGGDEPPPPPPPPSCSGTNDTNVSIPDGGGYVYSSIAISGCSGQASTSSTVEVHIQHTYRGDLQLDLIAPDGTAYRLKNYSWWDSGDDVDTVYQGDLSGETANGTWKLRMRDVYRGDTGYLDTWTITL